MADESKPEAPASEEAKPTAKAPLMGGKASAVVRVLIGILVVILLVAISAVTAYKISNTTRGEGAIGAGQRPDDPDRRSEITYDFYDKLGTFTALPTDENGVTSASLRVKIVLAVDASYTKAEKDEIWKAVADREVVIKDEINSVLLGIRPSEYRKNQAQGFSNLKGQILQAVNKHLPRAHQVNQVLFTEYIFQ